MATLNRRAAEAAVEFGAHAATDITGFGLLGHAAQVAQASGVTLRLHPSGRWLLPRVLEHASAGEIAGGLEKNRAFYGDQVDEGETPEDMRRALYDPQTSGGLLIALTPRRAAEMLTALRRRRVWAVEIGEAIAKGPKAIVLE
jgi:selenide,water dikinase